MKGFYKRMVGDQNDFEGSREANINKEWLWLIEDRSSLFNYIMMLLLGFLDENELGAFKVSSHLAFVH